MVNIIQVLNDFYLALGLKINIHKSNLYGIGVTTEEVEDMAQLTSCSTGKLPFTYLGLPIGSSMTYTTNWQVMIDKFRNRLSSWKANLLSVGGRLTLLKVVLGSVGIYYMSIFKVPESILDFLEKLRARFFWGGDQHFGIFRKKGGLGVGSLKTFNLALLQK